MATIAPIALPGLGLNDHLVAGHRRRAGKEQIVQQERLRPPDWGELDGDVADRCVAHDSIRVIRSFNCSVNIYSQPVRNRLSDQHCARAHHMRV